MAKMQFFTEPITYAQMIKLNDNYKNGKRKKLNQGLGKLETNAIWFEKNNYLRDFFIRILGDSDISGVRVYLCEFLEKQEDGLPKNTAYLKQLSVAFVPTFTDGDGTQVDFPDYDDKGTFILTGGALDNGTLCPPDTGCH